METAPAAWYRRLRDVQEFVRARSDALLLRDAGAWIDDEYSERALRARRAEAVHRTEAVEEKRETEQPSASLPNSAFAIPGADEGKDARFWCLNALGMDLWESRDSLNPMSLDDPAVWGARVLLFVCLATDRDAESYLGEVTQLACLPWEDREGNFGRGWNTFDDLREGKSEWPAVIEQALDAVQRKLLSAWGRAEEAALKAMQPYEARLQAILEEYPHGWTDPDHPALEEFRRLAVEKHEANRAALAKHGFPISDDTIRTPADLADQIDHRVRVAERVRRINNNDTPERRTNDTQEILDWAVEIIVSEGFDVALALSGSPSERLAWIRRELRKARSAEGTAVLPLIPPARNNWQRLQIGVEMVVARVAKNTPESIVEARTIMNECASIFGGTWAKHVPAGACSPDTPRACTDLSVAFAAIRRALKADAPLTDTKSPIDSGQRIVDWIEAVIRPACQEQWEKVQSPATSATRPTQNPVPAIPSRPPDLDDDQAVVSESPARGNRFMRAAALERSTTEIVQPVPIVKAAEQINCDSDQLLDKLRRRHARINERAKPKVVELDDLLACVPEHKRDIRKWANTKYPVLEK
ncbi:MAG: hypothetical protein AB7G11_15705 [Phycisphaerales bacterium]